MAGASFVSIHWTPPKEQHDADFDFDHWWVDKYGEMRQHEDMAIYHYIKGAFRAGWEAHKEEMLQQAMGRDV
jgi:hypothetical protein